MWIMLQDSVFINATKTGEIILPKELFEWYGENSNEQAVVIWNKEGDIVYLSPGFNTYTKIREEIFLGESLSLLFYQSIIINTKDLFTTQQVKLNILYLTIRNCDYFFIFYISQLIIHD